MKENHVETIKKVSKIESLFPFQDKDNIQIEVDVAVTRVTSKSELLSNKYALERDMESLKSTIAEVENKLKDLDALIARIDTEIPRNTAVKIVG